MTVEDLKYGGSRYETVRNAIFANPYYLTWGAVDEPPLPTYAVTLGRALRGALPGGRGWRFLQASRRSVDSRADLRWGHDNRGFRRILHPNGVCLTGTWEIDAHGASKEGNKYTGYFSPGSKGLIIARFSTCCSETRRGYSRSLALVGKIYPTHDPMHRDPLPTADFITQEDIGGARTNFINDVDLRNAPNVSPWRRGLGFPILLVTGIVLRLADRQTTMRQVYPIAELGKPADERTNAPEFLRLKVDAAQPRTQGEALDFREEVLSQIYDRGNAVPLRQLTFAIEVSDAGRTFGKLLVRRRILNWKRIGSIRFSEAVASYNGDFVLHFNHPAWRRDRNDPATRVRK